MKITCPDYSFEIDPDDLTDALALIEDDDLRDRLTIGPDGPDEVRLSLTEADIALDAVSRIERKREEDHDEG